MHLQAMQSARYLLIIMKYRLILCLLLVTLSTTVARKHGPRSVPRDIRIFGGYDASPRSHPYLVHLISGFFGVPFTACGGALLNERWILTAAHCVNGHWLINWMTTLEALVGTNDIQNKEGTAQTVRISESIPHPDFDVGKSCNDIAVLKTAKNIQYNIAVSRIELPSSMGSLKHKPRNLILAGWGVVDNKNNHFDKLQEVRVKYLAFEECKNIIDVAMKEFDEDNPLNRVDHICTGPITGGEKACSGDSGGPLIQYILYNNEGLTTTTQLTTEDIEYETTTSNDHMAHIGSEEFNDNTRARKKKHKSSRTKKTVSKVAGIVQKYKDNGLIPVVIGVVSWGISACGEVGAPTVYTNVSNHVDFINKHIYN